MQKNNKWESGIAPISVIILTLNEAHHLDSLLLNLKGWASQIFIVDSYSQDETIDIALRHGVHVVQRKFTNYGDQWNFAITKMPIQTEWVMKIDPDERLTECLKNEILAVCDKTLCNGFYISIKLFFMLKELPIKLKLARLWRTGTAHMSNVLVNEHLVLSEPIGELSGIIEHHDSPDLDHWFEKQNRYSTAEAIISYTKSNLADKPIFWGTAFQRRMWFKLNFKFIPLRFTLLFFYYWIIKGSFRAGRVGFIWSKLRSDIMRFVEYKRIEIEITKKIPNKRYYGPGLPDTRVPQFD